MFDAITKIHLYFQISRVYRGNFLGFLPINPPLLSFQQQGLFDATAVQYLNAIEFHVNKVSNKLVNIAACLASQRERSSFSVGGGNS